MKYIEALKKAMKENKFIALPDLKNESESEYQLIIKPYEQDLECVEFYGIKREWHQFCVVPSKSIREDWKVIKYTLKRERRVK